MTGYDSNGDIILEYNFIKEKDSRDPNHIIVLYFRDDYNWEEYIPYNFIDESYEGVWVFTYIGFDTNEHRIDIILVNTKTNQFI